MTATQTTTRQAVEGIARFLTANPIGASGLEQQALAGLDTDREAAIERGINALEQPAAEVTGTVETRVLFTAADLATAGTKPRSTVTNATRYYVARETGDIQAGFKPVIMARLVSLAAAKQHANALYDNGMNAPLVVCAPNRDAAIDKARRCYAREITCAQARSPMVS